ncbi:MAG: gluconokinase [Planctomycetes bacterium]|nr:gluconokinase [Planctomycetota bacterium]
MVYIVMGVSGSGKTTIGKMLAERLAVKFYDADDYHLQTSIDKMKNSIPLEDEDRTPWLLSLAKDISQWNMHEGAVLACSALKEQYRNILSNDKREKVVFIYLDGSKKLILKRMKKRKGHFFSSNLLESQFNTLEEPLDGIKVQIDKTPEDVCKEIIDKLQNVGMPST